MAETFPFNNNDEERNEDAPKAGTTDSADSPYETDFFTSEEVSDVIRIALRNHKADDPESIPYKEIVAIGADFGLSESDVDNAFDEIAQSRVVDEQKSQAGTIFKIHALVFLVINAALITLNVLTMPSLLWSMYPLIAWGSVVALHGILVRYAPDLAITLLQSAKGAADAHLAQMDRGQSLPFNMVLESNLMEASGLVQIQDGKLLIEYRTMDAILGVLKSDVKEVFVDFSEIASVRVEQAFWSTKLCLQGQRMRSFDNLPGNKDGRVRLAFNVRSRAAVDQLARRIKKRITEAQRSSD